MNNVDLYKGMIGISDEVLERSEKSMHSINKKKIKRKWLLPFAACILLAFFGVAFILKNTNEIKASDLMKGIQANDDIKGVSSNLYSPLITDFSIRIFKACYDNDHKQNQLISPVSILNTLGMLANGADGDTLKQIENVSGATKNVLNESVLGFFADQYVGGENRLTTANSIWIDESIGDVNQDFLQTNADYYSSDIYEIALNKKAIKEINKWVEEKTKGMIKKIIEDDSDDNSKLLFINALAFEGEWEEQYKDNSVIDGFFTTEDGVEENVQFMCSTEHEYIEDKNTTGFIKYYKDKRYAFVALLPDESISLSDYISSIDENKISQLLSNKKQGTVIAKLPKFEIDYAIGLEKILKEMGMTDAFNPGEADFSNIKENSDLYLNRVLHKTFIQVDEKGTKAAAVTAVTFKFTSNSLIYEVNLNKPFIYILIDCKSNTPLFIGTVVDFEN